MTTVTKTGVEVLVIFRADCQATKGYGSTVALVKGQSGKCRLYGKNALANAYPDDPGKQAIIVTLTDANKLAEHFKVKTCVGKAACDKFIAEHKIKYEGKEAVLADAGKSGKIRGGFKATNYQSF